MQIRDSLTELIGDTPLVRLRRTVPAPDGLVVAVKLEYLNPGGSVKDRTAMWMVTAAERSGRLRPGGTIVEPTSGNTGVGLVMVAQQRGYRCVFVCPDKVAADKVATLRAYGAQVVVCPTTVLPDHPDSYYSVSDRLAAEIPGAWKPDQYSNPDNPRSHYESTGPEIWDQTDGRVTHFVAGIGTGGTISGAGRYLKEVSGGRVRVIGADPVGSVYSGGSGRPYLVEGVGEDFWPEVFDKEICDEIVGVDDAESFAMTRRLAREEGLLVGGSSGMAVAAACRVAATAARDDVIVVLLPDGGRGYLAKVFNDDWMASHGFRDTAAPEVIGDTTTVGAVLDWKAAHALAERGMPELVHTHPHQDVSTAIALMQEYGVSQLPVLGAEPPIMAAEIVGSVREIGLLSALVNGKARPDDPIEHHVEAPLPILGWGEPVSRALVTLQDHGAAVVLADGRPIGVITRHDLLSYLAGAPGSR
jgi:cystathionine beta-synthase